MFESLASFFTTQAATAPSQFSPTTIFLNMFNGVIGSWTNALIEFIASLLVECTNIATEFLDMQIVTNAVHYAQVLAFAIIAPKIILEAINTYLLFRNGDPDADVTGTVIRAMTSTTVIIFGPWLVSEIFHFGVLVATDISKLKVSGGLGTNFNDVMCSISTSSSLSPLLILFVVIAIIIIILQITIRGAEVAFMKLIVPLLALNLTSANQGLWGMFMRQTISLALTQAIQVLLFMATMGAFMSQTGGNSMYRLLYIFGWLWISIKSPKIIKELIHSTGVGNVAHGAVNMVAGALIRKAV